jgi:hypothetical protein
MNARILFTTCVIVSALGSAAVQAEPQRQCYRLMPFNDVIDVIVGDTDRSHVLVYGRWTDSFQSGGISGAWERTLESSERRFSLTGTLGTSSEMLFISLDAVRNGAWQIRWISPSGTISSNSGTPFQKVNCANPLGAARGDAGNATDPK